MKKLSLKAVIVILSVITINMNAQTGSFRVSGDRAQLGYQNYRWLGFGFNPSAPTANESQWSIEHWDGGLNFWKPWPSPNAGNYKMFIHDQGFVGINGKPNPGRVRSCGFLGLSNCSNFRLQVFGNAIADAWHTFSDSSIKENVTPVQNVMTSLMRMSPIEYNYKASRLSANRTDSIGKDSINDNNIINTHPKRRYGFTSQQVKRVFPLLEEEYTENLGCVDYVGFVPLLVAGAQEQQRTIDTLRKTVDSLNLQVQSLRQEIINWQGRSIDTIGQYISRLFQNNPNPFDGVTNISYFIDENISVSSAAIEVRDIMGNLKATLTLGDRSGLGQIEYNGSNLTQGYYIYTLKINGSVKDSKMFLKEQ
jgi:hypothetical protein